MGQSGCWQLREEQLTDISSTLRYVWIRRIVSALIYESLLSDYGSGDQVISTT